MLRALNSAARVPSSHGGSHWFESSSAHLHEALLPNAPLDVTFWRLLQRTLAAVVVGASLVALCYFFVDRPVAFFVHDHHLSRDEVLKWLTYPPPIFQAWVPVVLVLLMVRRAWARPRA